MRLKNKCCGLFFFLCFICSLNDGRPVIWLYPQVCCLPFNLCLVLLRHLCCTTCFQRRGHLCRTFWRSCTMEILCGAQQLLVMKRDEKECMTLSSACHGDVNWYLVYFPLIHWKRKKIIKRNSVCSSQCHLWVYSSPVFRCCSFPS